MSDIERERAVADAIILERAIRVMERRWPGETLSVPAVRAILCNMALGLRSLAERES